VRTTTNSVTLSWRDNSADEDGFTIYPGSASASGSSAGTGTVDATVNGLAPGTTYCFRITVFKIVQPFGQLESLPVDFPCATTPKPIITGVWTAALVGWHNAFTYFGSGLSFPPGARITSVKNVAVLLNDAGGVDMIELAHTAGDTKTLAALGRGQSTDAFNGRLASGSWDLKVTNVNNMYLYWGCTRTSGDDYFTTCVDRANIALEIAWTT